MIRARVVVEAGCLSSLDVSGHAGGGSAGHNLVCAGVTSLVRSVGEAIAERTTVEADGAADGPGRFALRIRTSEPDRAWLRGVTDVLLSGLVRIAADAREDVDLVVEQRGERDGT